MSRYPMTLVERMLLVVRATAVYVLSVIVARIENKKITLD